MTAFGGYFPGQYGYNGLKGGPVRARLASEDNDVATIMALGGVISQEVGRHFGKAFPISHFNANRYTGVGLDGHNEGLTLLVCEGWPGRPVVCDPSQGITLLACEDRLDGGPGLDQSSPYNKHRNIL